MSLGQITKQLAQEALGSLTEPAAAPTPAGPDNPAAAAMGQIQAMQNALKDDQELAVTCHVGKDSVRVMEIFAPAPNLLVITGFDAGGALTRIVTAANLVQLVCKPGPVKPGAKPVRIRLVSTPAK
ncbi:MAG: hypothetical protein FJW39_09380 [Acidobacteria bacterium]|nr:hypothetical protein [Acidobacteriota bacterium]